MKSKGAEWFWRSGSRVCKSSALVYVTQVIHDQKVLTAAKDQKTPPRSEGFDVHGLQQKNWPAFPLWRIQEGKLQAALESFIKRGSLAPILDRLRGNAKVHIMHNPDEFLPDKKSIEELKEALGDQVTLYPHGGHLGNLCFPENKEEYVLRLFRTVP